MGRRKNRQSEMIMKIGLATAVAGIAKVLIELILKMLDLLDR